MLQKSTRVLRDISTIHLGYTARGRLEAADGNGLLTIQLRDISSDGLIDPKLLKRVCLGDLPDRYFVRTGDVVFRSRGERNMAVALDNRFREPALAVLPLFVLRPKLDIVLPKYLAWAMNQWPAQRHFDSFARGTNLRMVPRASLETLELHVPDIETQRRVVAVNALAERERTLSVLAADKRKVLTNLILVQRASGTDPDGRQQRKQR